jgi:hypothetical protein
MQHEPDSQPVNPADAERRQADQAAENLCSVRDAINSLRAVMVSDRMLHRRLLRVVAQLQAIEEELARD